MAPPDREAGNSKQQLELRVAPCCETPCRQLAPTSEAARVSHADPAAPSGDDSRGPLLARCSALRRSPEVCAPSVADAASAPSDGFASRVIGPRAHEARRWPPGTPPRRAAIPPYGHLPPFGNPTCPATLVRRAAAAPGVKLTLSAPPNSHLGISPRGAEPPLPVPPRACARARITSRTGVVSPVSTTSRTAPSSDSRARPSESAARHPDWLLDPPGPGRQRRRARALDARVMLPSPTAVGDHAPSTSNR